MIEAIALLLVAIGALTLLIPAWAFDQWAPEPEEDGPTERRRA
jgi:hypothetical protein